MITRPDLNGLPEDRDGFRFRGGCTPLDFTATLQARLKTTPRELLALPQDLDRWLVSAGLAAVSPGATAADLTTARILREAIFSLAQSAANRSFDAGAYADLNRIAATCPAVPALSLDGRLTLQGSAAALLSYVARQAVHLLGGPEKAQIRQCQSPTCTIFFVDTSRAGDRRWCSMSACGNKAKVAEFRKRKLESATAQNTDKGTTR